MQIAEGDVEFASGTQANNHLDMGYPEVPPVHRRLNGLLFANLVIENMPTPQFIGAVPNGATGWGQHLGNILAARNKPSPPIITLTKIAKRQFRASPDTASDIKSLIKASAASPESRRNQES